MKAPFVIMAILSQMLPRAVPNELERDKKIDLALYYYYSGKTLEAKGEAEKLKAAFPNDPFFHELMAEILWQELSKVLPAKPIAESVDNETVRNNTSAQYLVERFKEEIFSGLVLTQESLNQNPNDTKSLFLRAILKIRYAGFMAKFESGLKSYSESDRETAEGLQLIQKSIELDRSLCSAKYFFALSKYILNKTAAEAFYKKWAIAWKSRVYELLGRNFNQEDVFRWLDESMACSSGYYYAKDIEIDRMLLYQNILVKQSGRMDEKALPILEELNQRFPDNKEVRDNLFLVRLHLRNRSQGSRR